MKTPRFALALVAALMVGNLAFAQQPVPGAKNAAGGPAPVTGAAIIVAPSGGGAGFGRPVAEDVGLPIQGRDTVSGLPCAVGLSETCVIPGTGGGGGGGGAVTIADGADVATGATTQTAAGSAGANCSVVQCIKVLRDVAVSTTPAVVNQTQVNGVALLAGNGNAGTGSPRVTIAADNTPFGTKPGDGTNTITVKAASTAPATTDTAQVVAQSPVPALACPSKIAVSVTASTDLVTFTNTGYICSIVLVGAAAESWGLVDGTGTVCATGIAGVLGGTTGTMAFGANGGFVSVSDRPWLFTSGTAKHLCLIKSGAGNISGVITYRDF